MGETGKALLLFLWVPLGMTVFAVLIAKTWFFEGIRNLAGRLPTVWGWDMGMGARYLLECVFCLCGWQSCIVTARHTLPIFVSVLGSPHFGVWIFGYDWLEVFDFTLRWAMLWGICLIIYVPLWFFLDRIKPKRRINYRKEPLFKRKKLLVEEYDLLIVGGGVVGCAIAYVAAAFSNVKSIGLLEAQSDLATVNSNPDSNAETLHNGSTESNMVLEYALHMKRAARRMAKFLDKYAPHAFKRMHKMLLGVGCEEAKKVEARYEEFSSHYEGLRLLRGNEITEFEPMVMKGRKSPDEAVALLDLDGRAVDYQLTAQALVDQARKEAAASGKTFNLSLNTLTKRITKEGEGYRVVTKDKIFRARLVFVAAGPYSILFAHRLGLGEKYSILPIAGDFWRAYGWAVGKIYAFQPPGVPVARAHADAAVYDPRITRLGPTAMIVPLMIKRHWKTFFHYLDTKILTVPALRAVAKNLTRRQFVKFEIVNALSYLPLIGKWVFLRTAARHIFPTMRYRDLHFAKGSGGIRPQLLNLETGEMEMGIGKIEGPRILCIVTPSPGASKSLDSAIDDVRWGTRQFRGEFLFDETRFKEEFDE